MGLLLPDGLLLLVDLLLELLVGFLEFLGLLEHILDGHFDVAHSLVDSADFPFVVLHILQ